MVNKLHGNNLHGEQDSVNNKNIFLDCRMFHRYQLFQMDFGTIDIPTVNATLIPHPFWIQVGCPLLRK